MDILYVIFLSVFSLVVLFLLTKLIGYRQMSEMSMFDYISGITIGSIAAEMATAPDSSFLEPLTAMIVYGLLTAFLAFITEKNMNIWQHIIWKSFLVRLIFCLMMGIYMKEILRKDILICPNFLCNAV